MKTNYIQIYCIIVLSLVSVLDVRSQDKSGKTLASIKEKVQDVQIDKTTYKQSIDILDESKGKLSFISAVTDEKGKTTSEKFEFYVSDLDKNTITRKTSGKKLFISLSINNNQKYIKHFKDDKADSYTNSLEIILSGTDAAQELADLFKEAIQLVRSAEKTWNTSTDALNWLKANVSKINSGTATFEQSFFFGERKEYLAGFSVKKIDQKGASTEEKYEFSLLDIDTKKLAIKVSGTQGGMNLLLSIQRTMNSRVLTMILKSLQRI